jgi:hypothetical protein
LLAVALGVAAVPPGVLGVYILVMWAAGQPEPRRERLWPGVLYERIVRHEPEWPTRSVIHVLTVDMDRVKGMMTPTPSDVRGVLGELSVASTVSESLERPGADVAINGNFFTPCIEKDPLRYFPHSGDRVQAVGRAVGGGRHYGWVSARKVGGDPENSIRWVPVWHRPDGRVGVGEPVPADADAAVSGRGWLIRDGRIRVRPGDTDPADHTRHRPYARAAVGLDAERSRLWLVVVDGKQPRYSVGLTLGELAGLMRGLGAWDAVALDGGGSATLVVRDGVSGRARVLSRPCHTKIPGRERPVANALGVVLRR